MCVQRPPIIHVYYVYQFQVKTDSLKMTIVKRAGATKSTSTPSGPSPLKSSQEPACPYVNIQLYEGGAAVDACALVLLQNPCGKHTLTATELTRQVRWFKIMGFIIYVYLLSVSSF